MDISNIIRIFTFMEFIQNLALYMSFGCVWAFFCEWFTTRPGRELGPPWTMGERWLQLLAWPWFLIVFVLGFIDGYFDGTNNNDDPQ